MRSSNLKHCHKRNYNVIFSGSFIIAFVVAISLLAAPFCNLFFRAKAVTENDFRTLTVAVNEMKKVSDQKAAAENSEKAKKKIKKVNRVDSADSKDKKNTKKSIVTEKSEKSEKTDNFNEKEVKPVNSAKPVKSSKTVYSPKKLSLSKYDRNKLERLVEGEAGSLGYEGCLLVAQAIRDAMNYTGTTSIDKIINDYKYDGSTKNKPSYATKKAVAYIFDDNKYAVNHRVLYFYATDLVYSAWHETQKYITSCGNMKFFDEAI